MKDYLSIRHVTKRYRDFHAVSGIDLTIEKGEFITFLGPSGSGKSTLLYMISGLSEPSSGEIVMQGRSLVGVPANQRNIGMVFQRYTLIPHLNVADNIAFPLKMRRWPKDMANERLREMLALVRLESFAGRKPTELSGGQQQRVALARALAYAPAILLMDEPLAALDKSLKEELQTEIRRIHRETGTTIIYVTHDQEEALRLSDRIAVFNHGRIEQIAQGDELYVNPANKFVAGFVGNSNFLPAVVTDVAGGTFTVALPDGTQVANARAHSGVEPGDKGVILVRPESLDLRAGDPKAGGAAFEIEIRDMTYLGETLQVLAATRWNQEISIRGRPADLKSTTQVEAANIATLPREPVLFLPDTLSHPVA